MAVNIAQYYKILYLLHNFKGNLTLILLLNDPDYEKQQTHCTRSRGGQDLSQLLQTFIEHFSPVEICSVRFYFRFIAGSKHAKKKILKAGNSFTNLCIIPTFRFLAERFLFRRDWVDGGYWFPVKFIKLEKEIDT